MDKPLTHWKGKALCDMSREELIELCQLLFQNCLNASDRIDAGSELIAELLKQRAVRPQSPQH
jgi:hypothetical protein